MRSSFCILWGHFAYLQRYSRHDGCPSRAASTYRHTDYGQSANRRVICPVHSACTGYSCRESESGGKEDVLQSLSPVPPISEQKRIVQKVSELSPCLEQYAVTNTKLLSLNSLSQNHLQNHSILKFSSCLYSLKRL